VLQGFYAVFLRDADGEAEDHYAGEEVEGHEGGGVVLEDAFQGVVVVRTGEVQAGDAARTGVHVGGGQEVRAAQPVEAD
jgi:hypothetical protein